MSSPVPPQASQYLCRVADGVPSMLAYWDSGLVCRYANHAYERWFGVDPDTLLGTTLPQLLGPELFALNEPHVRAALAGDEQTFERTVPGPGGVQRHALAHYIPDRDAQGRVCGFSVLVTEITQLKEAEAALQREQAHAQELATLLKERTEMLDLLSHEVRQPLNQAASALQGAVSASNAQGAHVRQLERAQAAVSRVIASVDNTLAVMSMLARPAAVLRLDADIDTLVQLVIADMPAQERARIRVERATGTRTASLDVGLVRLALRNLLANALRYSPPGSGVTVRISDSDDPLALLIDVADHGGGIEPGLLPHLFERGARGRRTGGKPGHGLGLYIVRRVMELHGGRAELLSSSAHGTTMRLVIAQ